MVEISPVEGIAGDKVVKKAAVDRRVIAFHKIGLMPYEGEYAADGATAVHQVEEFGESLLGLEVHVSQQSGVHGQQGYLKEIGFSLL
jgi:hypothetical protein